MFSHIVNSRTGIVRSIQLRKEEDTLPIGFVVADMQLSNTLFFHPYKAESACAGYGFSLRSLQGPTLGETTERYCACLFDYCTLQKASTRLLTNNKEQFISPNELVFFAEHQYSDESFPFKRYLENDQIPWAVATSMLDKDQNQVLVPAEFVWPQLPFVTAKHGKAMTPLIQSGLAAGENLNQAYQNALLEIVERDSVFLGWVGRRGVKKLVVDYRLQGLGKGGKRGMKTMWISFPNEFNMPVAGCIIEDRKSRYLCMGTACAFDMNTAARKAFMEACQLWHVLSSYNDPDSYIGHASIMPGSPLKPYREDRAYHLSYKEDFSDVRDYGCHLQIFLDTEIQELFWKELEKLMKGEERSSNHRTEIADLERCLVEKRMLPLLVDISTPDLASLHQVAVRLLIPGTLPNQAAGLIQQSNPRLLSCLQQVGEHEPLLLPLPH